MAPKRNPGADQGFGIRDRFDAGSVGGGQRQEALGAGWEVLLKRLSGWVPPDDALSFYLADEQDTAIVEDITFDQQYTVPASHRGIVQFFQGLSTVVDSTFAGSTFTIMLDNVPVPGYEAIPIFQAGGAQGNVPGDTWIKLRENQRVAVQFHHAQASARHVGFQLRGFVWPHGSETAAL